MTKPGGVARAIGLLGLLGGAVLVTSVIRLVRPSHAVSAPTVLGAHTADLGSITKPVAVFPPVRTADTKPPIAVKAAYLLDVSSAYPMYAENADQEVPIASVTKLMTAVVARQHYALDEVATADAAAVSVEGSKILLHNGEQMDVKSLLTGLLIQSGNDAAMTLAAHMGLEAFVKAMNDQAAYLGMTHTLYKDPAGLNDEGHSTAHDLAILAAYVMRDEVIRSIVIQPEATVQSVDGSIRHTLQTSNRLIKQDNPLYVDAVTGLKTGFTPDAGHCLVATASKDGHDVVSVVLHTASDTADASAAESRKLLLWGFGAYTWTQ